MSISDDCALIIRLKYQLVFDADVGKIELQISYSTIKNSFILSFFSCKKKKIILSLNHVRPNYIQCIHVLLL